MTRRNVFPTQKIQKDCPKAENNTFWSDSPCKISKNK